MSTGRRLLLVTHFYPTHRGGVEIVAGELAARLATSFDLRWAAGRDSQAFEPPTGVELVPLGVWHGIERRTGVPVPLPGVRAGVRLWREVRREAMARQGKCLIRLTVQHWGPIATGGFPARLATA